MIRFSRLLLSSLIFVLISGIFWGHELPQRFDSLQVLCSSAKEVCAAWETDFENHTGLTIKMVRLPTNEAITRLKRFRDNPEFDVWHGGPVEGYLDATELGLLSRYTPQGKDKVPTSFKDQQGYWTGVYVGILGFCVNTEVVSRLGAKVPSDWEDLTDPVFSHQISMSSPASSGTAFTLLQTQVQRLGTEQAAFSYLHQLDRNVLRYTASGVAPANVTAEGETAVGLVFSSHCDYARIRTGAPLEVRFPVSGTGFEVGGVALIKGSPHPDLARRYVDYALSVSSQEQGFALGITQFPTRIDAPHAASKHTEKATLLPWDAQSWAARREVLIARFRQEILHHYHQDSPPSKLSSPALSPSADPLRRVRAEKHQVAE